MSSLPPFVLFVNGDLTYRPEPPPYPPDLPVFIGSQPELPSSYASVSELKNLQIQLFIDDTGCAPILIILLSFICVAYEF
jgi:hypothetical protein